MSGPACSRECASGWLRARRWRRRLRIPMIGISSLDLLAFPHRHTDRVVVPVIDARKGEVFWAMYRQVPGGVQQVAAPTVGPVDELVADLLARSQEVLCVGDGAIRYHDADPRRLSLRVRRLGPSFGGAAGAARPRACAARGMGEPPRDRADLPAPARCPDQLGDAGVALDERAPMSVLARLLQRRRRRADRHRGDATQAPRRHAPDRARRVPETVVAGRVRE